MSVTQFFLSLCGEVYAPPRDVLRESSGHPAIDWPSSLALEVRTRASTMRCSRAASPADLPTPAPMATGVGSMVASGLAGIPTIENSIRVCSKKFIPLGRDLSLENSH